ncbi:hypothetical protein [Dokdonia sp.]|uniref:hypothetical protein n=1 Tax=Dokdonia sp. TaxID=2024995 RepID=UPI0032660AC4
MTSGLRKAHKIIWIVLGLLGAVLIVLSINSVKQPFLTDSDASIATITEGVHTIEDNTQFYMSIEEQANSNKLQIVLKTPLKSASTVVYTLTPDHKKGAFLGTIDKKGLYAFDIDKSIKKIQLYDGIKNNEIRNIDLSWE